MSKPRIDFVKNAAISRCIAISLFLLSAATQAAIESQTFDSEAERQRYQSLIHELRCPKCQNQNLSGSDSQIAQDLRHEVARLIREGNNDEEVKQYMVNRYGDFVLYMPPVQDNTIALWLGPLLMLLVGVGIFMVIVLRLRKKLPEEENDKEN